MMTIEKFNKIPAGEIFRTGELPNQWNGLFMINERQGEMLTWVAKKGHADDWAIYYGWSYESVTFIANFGDKVTFENHIRKCVPCDDEVFLQYRR